MSENVWVIDNFLPPSLFNSIKRSILNKKFPWAFSGVYVDIDDIDNPEKKYIQPELEEQFVDDWFLSQRVYQHDVDQPEPLILREWQIVEPILYFLEDKLRFHVDHVLRCNINCFLNQNRSRKHGFHNDQPEPHYVGLYYLTTNKNAPTYFEDGQEVEHVANRLLFFEAGNNIQNKHSSSLPTHEQRRIAVNMNFLGHFFK